MTIPILPGWGDELAKSLPTIGNAIARLVNPNHDTEVAFKKAITDNPALIQQFADLEKISPGTMQAMGLGKAQHLIDNVSFSSAGKQEKLNREILDTPLTPDQKNIQVATKLGTKTQEDINVGREKKAQEDELFKHQIASSDLNQELQRLNIKHTTGLIDDANADREAEGIFNKWMSTIPKTTNLYNLYQKKSIPPDVLAAGLKTKAFKERLDYESGEHWKSVNADLERQRIAIYKEKQGKDALDDYTNKRRIELANRLFESGGFIGSPDAYFNLLKDPALMESTKNNYEMFKNAPPQAQDNVKQTNPELYSMIQAYQGFINANDKQKEALYDDKRIAETALKIAIQKFKDGDLTDIDVQSALEDRNTALRRLQSAGVKDAGEIQSWNPRQGLFSDPATVAPSGEKGPSNVNPLADRTQTSVVGNDGRRYDIDALAASSITESQLLEKGFQVRDAVMAKRRNKK